MRTGSLRIPLLIMAFMALGGVFLVLAGRDESDSPGGAESTETRIQDGADGSRTTTPEPETTTPEPEADQPESDEPEATLTESTCPPDLSNCEVASGRIIFVERVDPDGDGDAHFVTASAESITGPGITIFDVRADLRPNPLPGVGDLIGGAGPVFPGSAGQKQIEVIEFHVAR